MMFFLLLYIHFSSCLWLFIAHIVNELHHPLEYKNCAKEHDLGFWVPNQWNLFKKFNGLSKDDHFHCQQWQMKYLFTFYNSLLLLTGNGIGPQSIGLLFAGGFLFICSALMNANIFGTICSIFEQINLKTLVVSSKVDMAN